MDIATFETLDRQLLEFFNGSNSVFLDSVAITFTSGLTWIPLYVALLYLVIKNSENMAQFGLIVASVLLCMLLSDGVAEYLVKPYVGRLRPSADPAVKYLIDVVGNYRESTTFSFPSAHAANTAAVAVFFSLLVRNKSLSVMLLLWSVLNCWTRLYLGVHYPGDILVGFLWGILSAVVSYGVYRAIYFRLRPRLNYISSQYTSTGYNHEDIDIVLLTGVLLCLYVVLRAVF
ncbi:MAG: phosphatase PAP2 family protein [Prevotella sp.]|nr:phosphatase PAP2 family protein [Prevotella sp.]